MIKKITSFPLFWPKSKDPYYVHEAYGMENVPRLNASPVALSRKYNCAVKICPSRNSNDSGKQKPSVLLTGKYLELYLDDDVLLTQLLYHFSLCSTSWQIPQQNHPLSGTFSTKWAIWAPSYLGDLLFYKIVHGVLRSMLEYLHTFK
jgi:hypothetical protein